MAVRRLAEQQPETFAFSNDNEAWAKGQIGKFPEGRQQSAVIPLLWRAQEQHDGWLPEPAIRYVADMLGMPYIRALEVATFYTMFNLAPVGRHFVQLCGTTPCMLRGSDELREVCRRVIGPESAVSADGQLSWLEVECLGACVNAPMVQINKDYYEDLTPDGFESLLQKLRGGEEVAPGPQSERSSSYPLGGPTSLTDEAAILRHPAHEEGPGDPAETAVAKGQPKAGDERLEEEVATDSGPVSDEIKEHQDGSQTVDPADTATSKVDDHAPQGEERSGDAAAQERSGPESSAVQKSEAAPVGGTVRPVDHEQQIETAREPAETADLVPPAPRKISSSTSAEEAAEIRAAAKDDSRAPLVLDAPRGEADDLKRISGIGPKLEELLHSLGFFHFGQLAVWTDENVQWVDDHLEGFNGRIARDDWVGQAKPLFEGDGTDFAKRHDEKGDA